MRLTSGTHRIGLAVVFGLLSVSLTACGLFGGGAPEGIESVTLPEREEQPPPLTSVLGPVEASDRLFYDNSGAVTDSLREVVRTAEAFGRTWSRATSGMQSPPPRPSVDFETSMAVLVAAGRMTPEDRVRVDSVGVRRERTASGELAETFVVVVRTQVGCGRIRVDAYPVEIVRVPRFAGSVRFVERRDEAQDCGGGSA